MSEFGSASTVFISCVAVTLLSAVAGCGQVHGLPDASPPADAALMDASVPCQWQLGQGRLLAHAGFLSVRWDTMLKPGLRGSDSSAWVISQDDEGTWLHQLDVNGDDLMPPTQVSSDHGLESDVSVDILLGRDGGGIVIYSGCPPEGEVCSLFAGGESEDYPVPQLRAFDADGVLGPVQYLDAPLSIDETLVGSAAGDGFVVVVANDSPANSLVQAVSATGDLRGPLMRGLFSTAVFAGYPVEPNAARFVLDPRADGSVWLATLEAVGRPRRELRTDIGIGLRGALSGIAVGASRARIVLTTLDHVYALTPAGQLEWTRRTARSIQSPVVVGETVFLLSSHGTTVELLRLGDMGSLEESVELGDLAFNPEHVAFQAQYSAVSTGSGLLLFGTESVPFNEPHPYPDRHVHVYPVRCLPPRPTGDAG